ncbi:MAG TPA: hypothetical protein VFF76_00085 [Holophagaceae bacterium]|jgi:hypothetical protein|nr:hypothetical protein [Holophagaceae bacterium]
MRMMGACSLVLLLACGGGGSGLSSSASPSTDAGSPGADLNGWVPFPSSNPWNTDISTAPVDPDSATLIASIGLSTGMHPDFGTTYNGAPNGIPYTVVPSNQAKVPVSFNVPDESDPGPYPIPPAAPVEAGSDAHVLVVDPGNNRLWELDAAQRQSNGASWYAYSGAAFDTTSNALRTDGWTSADAAGLPIFPGLVRYDEVVTHGAIHHALRFTVQNTRHAYVHPATHQASSYTGTDRPPMGMRVRLKASKDISTYPAHVQVILQALKTYGMFVADNGGNWFISGAPDPRWDDNELATISGVKGSDFDVVQMGTVYTN